jgi:outer membrane protein OmpA-like peptidoglycan-associated protein
MASLKTIAVAGLLLTVFAGSALAESNYAVVHDAASGTPVRNTYGNCVHTKWLTDKDECPFAGMFTKEDRTVYFEFNKATLTKEARKHLDTLIAKIKAAGGVPTGDVVGYADRIGTASYNEKLSKKRAEAVKSYMVAHGIKMTGTTVRWLGDTEPTADCPPGMKRKELIKCLQPDRRVEVELTFDP